MFQYKFIKIKSNQPEDEVNTILNNLGNEGWKLVNFHPTSETEMSKKGVFVNTEPWDVGYVFVFVKENQ